MADRHPEKVLEIVQPVVATIKDVKDVAQADLSLFLTPFAYTGLAKLGRFDEVQALHTQFQQVLGAIPNAGQLVEQKK